MKSPLQSWFVAGALCVVAILLVFRNLGPADTGPPRPPPIDVWICEDSKNEVPFTSEQLLAAYSGGTYEQKGERLRVQCPECGKMSLYHDAKLSQERTLAQ